MRRHYEANGAFSVYHVRYRHDSEKGSPLGWFRCITYSKQQAKEMKERFRSYGFKFITIKEVRHAPYL